eukprot:UN3754
MKGGRDRHDWTLEHWWYVSITILFGQQVGSHRLQASRGWRATLHASPQRRMHCRSAVQCRGLHQPCPQAMHPQSHSFDRCQCRAASTTRSTLDRTMPSALKAWQTIASRLCPTATAHSCIRCGSRRAANRIQPVLDHGGYHLCKYHGQQPPHGRLDAIWNQLLGRPLQDAFPLLHC